MRNSKLVYMPPQKVRVKEWGYSQRQTVAHELKEVDVVSKRVRATRELKEGEEPHIDYKLLEGATLINMPFDYFT